MLLLTEILPDQKKPSPEIYEWTLEKLRLPPQGCIAIEDSPRGLEASRAANISTVVTPSLLTNREDFKGAALIISHLGEPDNPFQVISGEDFGLKYVNTKLLEKLLDK